ncbi:MAG: HEPN domain-containing protein, partial [Ignisphaera sp.]
LAEQSLQLYLKAILLKLVGDYPRTHSIRRLLGELGRVLNSEALETFINANRARVLALEDAYLIARYSAKEYEKEDAM